MRFNNKNTAGTNRNHCDATCSGGFTLAEVVISVALAGIIFSGILEGYVHAGRRAEWSGYNLAAGAIAMQQIEQARAAVWDTDIGNNVTKIALLNKVVRGSTTTGYNTNIMDIPYSGGASNYLWVTNYVTIAMTNVVGNTNVPLQFIKVDAVWRFQGWRGANNGKLYTNTVATMISPDDRMLGN